MREHAARRVALAEAIVAGKPRPAGEVILDVANEADVMWRWMRERILEPGDMKPGEVAQLLTELGDRAGKWAKTVMDIGLEERWVRIAEDQATQMLALVGRVLDGLGLSESQRERANSLLRQEAEALLALPKAPKVIEGKAKRT